MRETSKAESRRVNTWLYDKIFQGDGIDIGCGNDLLKKESFPNIKSVMAFDQEHGDANNIDQYFQTVKFDFVHGSQVLEHLYDPISALNNFLTITKPGGYVIMTVPDEDLYEKNLWPSKYNHDHKVSFSIYKPTSVLPKHYDLLHVIPLLKQSKVIKLELVDTNYDYSLPKAIDQTMANAEAFIELILQKV